jgi:cell division protein FtsB
MDIRVIAEKFEDVQYWVLRRRKTLASVAMCVAAVLIAYHVFAGTNGIKVYFKKQTENQALQQDLDRLKKENEDLSRHVKALKSDPQAIEKEAREQLRYVKPGEIVYVNPEQKPPAPPPNATAQQVAPRKKP